MDLKTSKNVHFHGADGVYAQLDEHSGELHLYWGESKLNKSLHSAISSCFESISKILLRTGGSDSADRRDLELLVTHFAASTDLDDDDVETIVDFFDPDKPSFNKLVYHGVCLVGYDEPKYETVSNTDYEAEFKLHFEKESIRLIDLAVNHISKHSLDSVEIVVFFVPFPSVETFRLAFLREVGISVA